jgi:hypothetical protein
LATAGVIGQNLSVHLHEVDVHEERLVVVGVLLDVVDGVVGLPNVEIGEDSVGNAIPPVARL